MKTNTTLPITEARKNIFNIAEEVQKENVYYTLTEFGKPKMVLLSAKKFEILTQKKNNEFVLADRSRRDYDCQREIVLPKVFVIRDESRVVYLSNDDENLKHKEIDLIKSQLFIKLIENCKYPLRMVEIGRYVKIGGEKSRRYTEADLIVNDEQGNARIVLEVGSFDDYEDNLDSVVSDLFDIGTAVAWIKKPEWLIYFSRSVKNGLVKEKVLAIDCSKFNTFSAWKKAGRSGEKAIPDFC